MLLQEGFNIGSTHIDLAPILTERESLLISHCLPCSRRYAKHLPRVLAFNPHGVCILNGPALQHGLEFVNTCLQFFKGRLRHHYHNGPLRQLRNCFHFLLLRHPSSIDATFVLNPLCKGKKNKPKRNSLNSLINNELRKQKEKTTGLFSHFAFSLIIKNLYLYAIFLLLAKEWLRYVNKKKKEYGGELPSLGDYGWLQIARHFAEWQKEQMMKDAVEGEICGRVYDHINVRFANGICKYLEPKNISHIPADVSKYKPGQKVKIIILKDDEYDK